MAIITSESFEHPNEGTRLVRQNRLIRLARGVYSDEVRRDPETIVAENWVEIVAFLAPDAVITNRSAFSMRPEGGYLYVAHSRTSPINLPGLSVIVNPGAPPQPRDNRIRDHLYTASTARALVDNLAPSRASAQRPAYTLSRTELHEQVVRLATGMDSVRQQALLAQVDEYANLIEAPDRAESIHVFFEAARGERPSVDSDSPAMRAAQHGHPIDERRIAQFEELVRALSSLTPRVLPEARNARYLPFFEAYFSNFIEGTEFDVDEARAIVFDGVVPERRPADAHDISGTYAVVSDEAEMRLSFKTSDEFISALKRRHALIMGGRPERLPGEFKDRVNRAGNTDFVHPTQVEGTLRAGWDLLGGLTDPFARAVYTMYFVSEVHPFIDGNGRVTRIMMNSALIAAHYSRIVVPTVIRNDYMSALAAMSHNNRSVGLVNVLDFCQRYTAAIGWDDYAMAKRTVAATNGFDDSTLAERAGVRLLLPSELEPGWKYAEPQVLTTERHPDSIFDAIVGEAGAGEV